MDIYRSEYGITVSAGGDYEYEPECLTRWECVKAAFALLWNACLPLPKPAPRPVIVPGQQSAMCRLIIAESLRVLQSNPSFLAKINGPNPIEPGGTIKIRLPVRPVDWSGDN